MSPALRWAALGTVGCSFAFALTLLLAVTDHGAQAAAPSFLIPPHSATAHTAGKTPWEDRAWLVANMRAACDAVEFVCGAKFRTRPGLRVVTPEVLVRLAREEEAELRRRGIRKGPEEERTARSDEFDLMIAESTLGQYMISTDTVLVVRRGVEVAVEQGASNSLLTPGSLRMVLVHEVAHALDAERFEESFHAMYDEEASDVASAVFEGHAQHVCARVTEFWGHGAVFRDLCAWFEKGIEPETARAPMARHSSDEHYVQGQAFIDAVHFERGRGGIDQVLDDLPSTYADILRPQAWIQRQR